MINTHKIGVKGEDIAVLFLEKNGYTILERNWRYGNQEIDIIAQIAQIVVFVEVKFRKNKYYGLPEQAVGVKKEERIKNVADEYIFRKKLDGEIRFDIIAIVKDNYSEEIYHIVDAF